MNSFTLIIGIIQMEDSIFSRVIKDVTVDDYRQCPNGHGVMLLNSNHGYICKTCGVVIDNINIDINQDNIINSTHNTYVNSGAKIVLTGNNSMRRDLFKNTSTTYSLTQKRNSQIAINKALYNNNDIPPHIGIAANEMFSRIVQYHRKQYGKDNIYEDEYDISIISSTPESISESKKNVSDIFDDETDITIASSFASTQQYAKSMSTKEVNRLKMIEKLKISSSINESEYDKLSTIKKTGTWRTKVRLGLICSCIHYECIRNGIKKPSKVILKNFKGLEEKYLTRGCKELRKYHELGIISLPEEENNETKAFIERYMAKLNLANSKNIILYKNFVYNLMCEIDDKNIMGNTAPKTSTRCASIIYIMIKCIPEYVTKYSNAEFATICDNKSFSSIKTYIEIIQNYLKHFKPVFKEFNINFPQDKIIKDRVKKIKPVTKKK